MNCKYLRIASAVKNYCHSNVNYHFFNFRLQKAKKSQQKQTIDKNTNKTKSKTGGLSCLRERLRRNNPNNI